MKINNKYKILTPTGFEKFDGIKKVKKSKYLEIIFDDNSTIKCSLDHPFIINGQKLIATDLKENDYLEMRNQEKKLIKQINTINKDIELYDIINVRTKHVFYANNILSSNCDADFLSSGNSVIDSKVLKWYEHVFIRQPKEKRYNKRLWLWEYPDPKKTYLISADVARGDATDYSAFHILDVDTLEQVAEFQGKIDTQEYGNMLVNLGNEYNEALLVIENASIGWAVIQVAIDRNYKNLYYTTKDFKYIDIKSQLKKSYDIINKEKYTAGFTTSVKTRPLIIEKLEKICNDKSNPAIIRSSRLIEELRVFIWNKSGRPEAQRGYNDDLVISYAIALWIRDTAIRLRNEGILLTKKLLGSTKKSEYSGVYRNKQEQDSWKINIGEKDNFDLRELL